MIATDASLTYYFLNKLASRNKEKMGFLVTQLAAGGASIFTTTLDVVGHLIASVLKAVTGIFATPAGYFSPSKKLKSWDWSAASRHLFQSLKFSINMIIAPIVTLLFAPKVALKILFAERVKIEKLQNKMIDSSKMQANPSIPNEIIEAINSLAEELLDPIDLEPLSTAMLASPCGHKFNENHVDALLESPCPLCITKVKAFGVDHNVRNLANKMENLDALLRKAGYHLPTLSLTP